MMKIAILGAGGVGGYFGALLARAGHEVTFIARGPHMLAMKVHGLSVKSPYGDFNVRPAKVTDSPSDIGAVDYVIVSVKQYQLPDAVSSIPPLIGPRTTVVPLLNGIDAHEHLIEVVGSQPVVGGLSSIVSMIEAPGVIRHESRLQKIVLGELDREKTERVENLVQAWLSCGVEAIHADDIFVALWIKFLFIASFGGITSLCRGTAGEVLDAPETRELLRQAMEEVEALALEQEIMLEPDIVQSTMVFIESLEPSSTSSMQRDVASGKPFELEAFSGTIVRLGRKLGVPTPVHTAVYALLLPALKRAFTSS
jgi:2-dehydropantoate 2-reductase